MLLSHETEIFSLYLFSNEICTMNFQTCKHPFLPFLWGLFLIVGSLSAQKIAVRPIPLLDKLPVKAIHRIFRIATDICGMGHLTGYAAMTDMTSMSSGRIFSLPTF